jgi:small subunit ribosomal protein S17
MEKKKTKTTKEGKTEIVEKPTSAGKCNDRSCPFHGSEPVKLRGRVFEGTVTRKLSGRVAIEFERILSVPKFERYEKRKTRLHARLPACLNNIEIGDLIQIAECRPLSKIIHFIVVKRIKTKEQNK